MGLMDGGEGQGDGYSAGQVLLKGCVMGGKIWGTELGVKGFGSVWNRTDVTGVILGRGTETADIARSF